MNHAPCLRWEDAASFLEHTVINFSFMWISLEFEVHAMQVLKSFERYLWRFSSVMLDLCAVIDIYC